MNHKVSSTPLARMTRLDDELGLYDDGASVPLSPNVRMEVVPCRNSLGNVTSYDLCLPQKAGDTGVAVLASVYVGEEAAKQIAEMWNAARSNQEGTVGDAELIERLKKLAYGYTAPGDGIGRNTYGDAARAIERLSTKPVQEATRTVNAAEAASIKFLRERYLNARCDSEAVADCVRCNTMFLVNRFAALTTKGDGS